MLDVLLHAHRGPFYSPKAARSRWEHSRKANLAFCRLTHRTVRCGFLSCFGAADRWRFGAVGAPDTVRCTPDSPVPPSYRWPGHASRADYAADRLLGRPLAHRTVWCTTGQSGAPPNSPVIYSRTLPTKPESSQFARASLAHRTLFGAPPDSPVLPDWTVFGWAKPSFFQIDFSYFQYLDTIH
jgi:hypothetical protein